jgi:hypothetical protein
MFLLSLLGLILPGLVIGRACGAPRAWTTSFPLSALLLTEIVIGYSLVGVPIRFATVLAATTGVTVLAAAPLVLRRSRRPDSIAAQPAGGAPKPLVAGSLILALLVCLGVLSRTAAHPLSGLDTIWRWDALARLMLVHEHLDYYPPVSAEDFEKYVFPDGMPPLAATVYWWLHAGWGEPLPALTSLPIALQLGLLMALVFFAAQTLVGTAGAYFALISVASSTLLITGVAIGQETGYTALSVAGQLCFALAADREGHAGCVVVAACFAALGALARDYGPVLSVAGLAVLAVQPRTRRWLPCYCLVIAALALPWYARNWDLTGNPLYPHKVAPWFPVHVLHENLMQSYVDFFGLQNLSAAEWVSMLSKLVGGAPLPLLLGMPMAIIAWRKLAAPVLVVTAVTAALWLWSVPYTAGGIEYSLRVLTPAWAALSISAGAAGSLLLRRAEQRVALQAALFLILSLLGMYGFAHAFAFPFGAGRLTEALGASRPQPLDDWHAPLQLAETLEKLDHPSCGVLTDCTYVATALQRRSRFRPVMIWSPQVAFVFDRKMKPSEIRDRLREMQIFFVAFVPHTPNGVFVSDFPFYRDDRRNWEPVILIGGQHNPREALYYLPP